MYRIAMQRTIWLTSKPATHFARSLSTIVGSEASKSHPAQPQSSAPAPQTEDCGTIDDYDSDDDYVQMIDEKTGEWGGPTKGGTKPEPTRYGDWERNGRCTDFV